MTDNESRQPNRANASKPKRHCLHHVYAAP